MTALLSINHLHVSYHNRQGELKACHDINLKITKGMTLGLIGETGCGKSTLALSVLRLLPSNTSLSGEILFQGQNLLYLNKEEMRQLRGKEIALIPQSSGTCLNPVLQIGKQLEETLKLHQNIPSSRAWQKAVNMLQHLKLPDARRRIKHYPHQLSGGMKQRVLAALGMAGNPSLLIADEPTKGLDAVARYQVTDILRQLGHITGAGTLLITHDLKLAHHLCDWIAVMYAGEIVEQGPAAEVLQQPLHPYTAALLASLPGKELQPIPGNSPDLLAPPPGCCFHPRCSRAQTVCSLKRPILQECSERQVRCNYIAAGKEFEEDLSYRIPKEKAI
jgi:peptide/nickel transport system ATP-binding protein